MGEQKPDLVGILALLTASMPFVGSSTQALVDARLGDSVRVRVLGGRAPLAEAYAGQMRSKGYAPDAGSAVRKARDLLDLM